MQSLVHLFNAALSRIGGEQIPQNRSPEEEDAVGSIAASIYPHVLDNTLAAHNWGFARKRVKLASKPEVVPDSYAYRYRFGMPSDCIRPLQIFGSDGGPAIADLNDSPAFIIEGNDILCNIEKPEFAYIYRVTETKLWPAPFADAMVWAMAAELASARLNDTNKQTMCFQRYETVMVAAKAWDISVQRHNRPQSAWMTARGNVRVPNRGEVM